ncbi:MAG TPA: hypothetical protein V6C65_39380, partial [Allocoleopsis sp.]
DTLRAYHKQMLFRKELIQKERYDNCYLLTLDDPTVPTGQMQLLQPSTAIALLDKLMAEAPPMPELDRSNTLEICCPEYFAQVVAQAKEMGLEEDLKEKLEYLRNYSDRYWYRCRLYQDFAPMSFTWSGEFKETEDGEWKQMIYAGLIFHQSSQEWGIHS